MELPEKSETLNQNLENAISSFMEQYKISMGSVCVMRGSKVLENRGFGTDKETLFRIGSITKLFTRVGILKLVDQRLIGLDDKAFPLLDLTPLPGQQFNSDLNKITIDQLLNHQAGWDQEVFGDLTFKRSKIAQEMINVLGKDENDITPTDMVRFMLSKPLQYEPGTKGRVYCNFGYSVLGRIIEKVSGKEYYEFIRDELTHPLGLDSIQRAHTAKDKTLPNEAIYEKDSSGQNDNEDPYRDLCFEMADSAGGLISNAKDLCIFLDHYWGNGQPRTEQTGHTFYMNGRCVGTLALAEQLRNGINVVVLFNNRHNRDNQKDDDFRKSIEDVLN